MGLNLKATKALRIEVPTVTPLRARRSNRKEKLLRRLPLDGDTAKGIEVLAEQRKRRRNKNHRSRHLKTV
jgi:hypothetical protein